MDRRIPANVDVAFELLLEEIEIVANAVEVESISALTARDFSGARTLIDRLEILSTYRQKVDAVRREWEQLDFVGDVEIDPASREITDPPGSDAAEPCAENAVPAGLQASEARERSRAGAIHRTTVGRLARGMRTRQEAYFLPILRIVTDMGGRAAVGLILDRIGEVMKPILKEVDHQSVGADGYQEPRWRNTAKWARNTLVQDGFLKSGSPHGIWEISEQGHRWLASHRSSL